jgi:hypothetical protein
MTIHQKHPKTGVADKHDFLDIQRKIPQISDFAEKQDLNPPPHGDTAADIAKKFANFFCENQISGQKTRFLQKSNRIFAKFPRLYRKNRIPRKTIFAVIIRKHPIFVFPYQCTPQTCT